MYKYVKRYLDILVSLIILVVFFIPLVLISVAIKLDSRGPVFFKQKRTGKDGREFFLYKFRSMVDGNDVYDFKSKNDLTRVGRFIRKASLDELPQIINILKGDMSFIGPRPWIVEYYENFTDRHKRRVEVLPGITGLAQALGRNDLSVFDKINYDIAYVDNMSFKTDLKIVFLTIKTVLSKKGAEITKSGIKTELEDLHENYLYFTGQVPVIPVRCLQEYEEVGINY